MQSIVFACDILPNNKIWLLLINQRSLTKQINNKNFLSGNSNIDLMHLGISPYKMLSYHLLKPKDTFE